MSLPLLRGSRARVDLTMLSTSQALVAAGLICIGIWVAIGAIIFGTP